MRIFEDTEKLNLIKSDFSFPVSWQWFRASIINAATCSC